MFFKGSRYETVATAQTTDAQGRTVSYKKTRFIQQPDAQRTQIVSQGDRLDLIAYRYFRDSERFWRICDCNFAVRPDDLLALPGSTILIPDSEG